MSSNEHSRFYKHFFSLSHLAFTPWETRKCIGRVQELRQKCKRGGGVDKLLFMNEGQVVGIRLSLGESLGEVRLSGSSPASLTFFFEPASLIILMLQNTFRN